MSSAFSKTQNQIGMGFHYFVHGWQLLCQRQFLPFVIFPVLINMILMIGLGWRLVKSVATFLVRVVKRSISTADFCTVIDGLLFCIHYHGKLCCRAI